MSETPITIRPATHHDAPEILAVHRASVVALAAPFYDPLVLDDWSPDPSPPERLEDLIVSLITWKEIMFVAEHAAAIVGFGSIVPTQSELRSLYMHPDYIHRGIGRRIYDTLEKMARKVGLTELKLDASLNAEHFYRALGFQLLEKGEHTLRSGRKMGCLKMVKAL